MFHFHYLFAVPRLSDTGRELVTQAANKYLNALADLIRRAESESGGAMERMSRLMMFLSIVEVGGGGRGGAFWSLSANFVFLCNF